MLKFARDGYLQKPDFDLDKKSRVEFDESDTTEIGAEELRYAVVVSTAFHIKEGSVSGYMVIVLGVSSLDRLLKAIETWEESQRG